MGFYKRMAVWRILKMLSCHRIKPFQQTAERFESVTVFFGDIVGFNQLTADCSALEVLT